jgi:hypothetical protein
VKITAHEARTFFLDPTQRLFGFDPETLPDDVFEYWADGPFLGIFVPGPLVGTWVIHIGAKRVGGLEPHARAVLNEFWAARSPERVIAWTPSRLPLAVALAKRCGFREDGRFPYEDGEIIMTGWSKCQQD